MSRRRSRRGLSGPLLILTGFYLALVLVRWALPLLALGGGIVLGAMLALAALGVRRRVFPRTPRRTVARSARRPGSGGRRAAGAGPAAGKAPPALPAAPMVTMTAPPGIFFGANVPPAPQNGNDFTPPPDPHAALRAKLRARADQVAPRIPPPPASRERQS